MTNLEVGRNLGTYGAVNPHKMKNKEKYVWWDPKDWGRTRRPEKPIASEGWWRRNLLANVISEESVDLLTWLDKRGERLEAASGSSKMSSPTKRSEGSRRKGGSTWNDGLQSRITLKASEWIPCGVVLMAQWIFSPFLAKFEGWETVKWGEKNEKRSVTKSRGFSSFSVSLLPSSQGAELGPGPSVFSVFLTVVVLSQFFFFNFPVFYHLCSKL